MEASYLNGRDFEISIDADNLTYNHRILTVGNNDRNSFDGNQFLFELKEYHTFFAGTCYQITSNFSMPPPSYLQITLTFNNSLDEIDQPKVRGYSLFLSFLILLSIFTTPSPLKMMN